MSRIVLDFSSFIKKFENTYLLTLIPTSPKFNVAFVDSPYGNWECPGFEKNARFNYFDTKLGLGLISYLGTE